MNGLTIGQVARGARVRASALRYYEAIGLLPAAERVSGWRRYGDDVFVRLAAIELAQRAGFSLDEIRALQSRRRAGRSALAARKLREVERGIARLRAQEL